jgi:hypothetical protein
VDTPGTPAPEREAKKESMSDEQQSSLPDPQYRVNYTESDGTKVSETAFTALDASSRESQAQENGATDVTVTPFKTGR